MPIPRVKTEATSVESPKSKCGDNWDKNIKVRNPYKGVDRFVRTLLSLAEVELVNARDDELPAQLELELARAKKMRGDHKSILNAEQRVNIDKYLARSQVYLKDAAKIQRLWAAGFATAGYGVTRSFPISTNLSDIGDGFCLNKPPGYQSENEDEPNCPTIEEVQGHNKDAEKWGSLILAAMKNIRCAEEVIRKAEVSHLNKAEWEATSSTRFEPPPMPSELPAAAPSKQGVITGELSGGDLPAAAIASFDDPDFVPGPNVPVLEDLPAPGERMEDDEEMGEGVLEGEEHSMGLVVPKKKKKKSSVPLIAAAGIGALLLLK